MSRLKEKFESLAEETALVSFVTAGDPTLEHTVPAMHGLVAGGTDVIELGIPFSDPEAEGPAIQASSERALANGVNMAFVLEKVAEFRRDDQTTPIVLMGYLNSILAQKDFPQRAQTAGVDGLIMVNLPPEEAGELQPQLADHDIDLIYLVAPTTVEARAQYILSKASGFVYYVSLKGTTGADNVAADEVSMRLRELRSQADIPVCVGFGIKDEATARALGVDADGVVVGSALVNLMAEHADDPSAAAQALEDFCRALKRGAIQG